MNYNISDPEFSTTRNITIWVGLKETETGIVHTIEEVELELQKYADIVGTCVTVIPTKYIYKNGNEPGVAIGFINYPRFPDQNNDERALYVAKILLEKFNQCRITIVTPEKSIMVSNWDLIKKLEKQREYNK